MSSSPSNNTFEGRAGGFVIIGLAVGLFVICSVIQAACGSSMFSASYSSSVGAFQELLLNLTFWPGWLGTVALGLLGVARLLVKD